MAAFSLVGKQGRRVGTVYPARAGVGMPDPSRQRRDLFYLGPYPVAAGNVDRLAAVDSLRQQGGTAAR